VSGMIAFQGQPGAYSDLACHDAYPGMQTLPCESFEAAIDAVRDGRATLGMFAVREQPGRPRAGYPRAAAAIRSVRGG